MFAIHPKLVSDTVPLGSLLLCRILLMNNAYFPWVILVPEREYLVELTDISISGRMLLMEEASSVMTIMKTLYTPDKLNFGALGNVVPQFHLHVVARFKDDRAWPDPVWGAGKPSLPYNAAELEEHSQKLIAALKELPHFRME